MWGKPLDRISNDCKSDRELLTSVVARNMRYFIPPPEEEWRIPLLLEMLDTRGGRVDIPGIDTKDIDDMIHEVCSN